MIRRHDRSERAAHPTRPAPAPPRRRLAPARLNRFGLLAAVLLALPVACGAQQPADGLAAYRQGDYEGAIAFFRARVREGSATIDDRRLLVRALAEVGRYEEAIAAAREAASAGPEAAVGIANALGEVLYFTGQIEAAEAAFRQAMDGGADDRLTAELNLNVLLFERGERETAMRGFDRFIDHYNNASTLSAADLLAVGTAVRYVGELDPQLFHDALRAYDEAIAAAPEDPLPRILAGELFLQKFRFDDAENELSTVLSQNPRNPRALLALARVLEFDGDPRAVELVRSALEVNPNYVPAHVQLAKFHMSSEKFDEAIEAVERALEVNPVSLDALSVLASIHYMRGDREAFDEATRRVLARNPRHADLYATIAELSVQQRLYQEAVDFARRAIELDSGSWRAFGVLGINQLRIGEIEAGRANLETAFSGDPFNPWYKNTLDLLDTFAQFEETVSPRFRIVIHERESALLGPYVAAIAEEAFDRLAERYGGAPPTPIRIEVFPSHADFSVRTVGLAGLGALGVSFGPVVAMDSPAARSEGDFNWASTLWHELSHSFHLALTEHRAPRWFSEGLATLEQRHARPGWGTDFFPQFLFALKADRLLPVAELNNGFVRPTYPDQVPVSYYQASVVMEKIERDHGVQALREMMRGYAAGRTTEELFRSVLGTSMERFDEELERELRERYRLALAALPDVPAPGDAQARAPTPIIVPGAPGGLGGAPPAIEELQRRVERNGDDFNARLALGRALFDAGRLDEALPHLERARDLFPEYGAPDSPYLYLARIFRERGDLRRAAEQLERLVLLDETNHRAALEHAEVLEELGDPGAAADALERVLHIFPYDMELHQRMAQLYGQAERWDRAIQARASVLALNPVDRASALYQLAYAYFRAGDNASARRYVLRALEDAPHFPEAQELLLELSGGAMAPPQDPADGAGSSRGMALVPILLDPRQPVSPVSPGGVL